MKIGKLSQIQIFTTDIFFVYLGNNSILYHDEVYYLTGYYFSIAHGKHTLSIYYLK